MSQENVEVVRDALAEFSETQQPSEEFVAPDFVWDLRSWPVWTGQAEFHGTDGFREFFAEWIDAYEEWTHEAQDFIDVDEHRVVATTVQRGRLRGSESWVELRAAFLYTIEDGLIRRIEVYESPEQALEAAGLSE
jgi:ketosteroid isomerase-like protein